MEEQEHESTRPRPVPAVAFRSTKDAWQRFGACRASLFVAYQRPQIPCGRFSCLDPAGRPQEKGHPMAGIPEQRCEANVDAEAQGAAPAALGADDARFMRRAIELAWRGRGWTNPNPLVGCVLVRDGRIIGEGWHV